MQIIIPMAGIGERFVESGYITPKPLIKVSGRPILEYVCNMFDTNNDEFIFICNYEHLSDGTMEHAIRSMAKNVKILSMPQHKLGPVYTVKRAYLDIENNKPAIIAYCDNPFIWDYNHFKDYINRNMVDGALVSHTGFHPQTLSSTLMAHLKIDTNDNRDINRVLEVKEKSCYTDDPQNEHASSGVYYFRYGSLIKKYCDLAIERKLKYNNEYYVTLIFNLMIQDGLYITSYLNDLVLALGTPAEVENFQSWQKILEGGQVTNEQELINCYRYWLRFKNHPCCIL